MSIIVSIIIPVFNRKNYIQETLNSVFIQTYTDWEIIVVDDESTDGTFDLLTTELKNKHGIIVTKNNSGIKGPAATRNEGLKLATGKYVIFLDSDDLLEPHCLHQRVIEMENHQDIDFAVFPQYVFLNNNRLQKEIFNIYPESGDTYLNMFLRNDNPWTVSCPIWKKSTVTKLSGFDESFFYMEDPDIHTRAIIDSSILYIVYMHKKPDSWYRLQNMDNDKGESFYCNSIIYRIQYLKKIYFLLNESNRNDMTLKINIINWKIGIDNLFKRFIIGRAYLNNNRITEFLDWLYGFEAITVLEYHKYRFVLWFWAQDSFLIRTLRLKGFIYYFIFKCK